MSGNSTSQFAGAVFIARWSELARWDIKSARAASFRAAYPQFVPFGSFVEEATEIVRPREKADHSWPVYGVGNKSGVEFSHYQRGAEFNAPYKRIKKDWFFHNPTRANVGSLGRVGSVPEDAITSPEYQVWRIKEGMLPDFIELLISLPLFLDLVQCHRVGAVKERLFVQNLMEIPVPAMSLDQQQAIVDHWKATQKKNAAALRAADKREMEVEATFLKALGLKPAALPQTQRGFALRWSDIQRWGVDGLRKTIGGIDPSKGRFAVEPLGSLLEFAQYGTSDKANELGSGIPVLRIGNIKDGTISWENLKHIELAQKTEASLRLVEGDILIIRTSGSRDLVGTCGVYRGDRPAVFASYLIRLRVNQSKAVPEFISYFINSPAGRQQVDAVSRQIMQNNINSEEIKGLSIPLPPLAIQQRLVDEVTAARAEIAAERGAAAKLAADTAREVEEMILGHCPVPKASRYHAQ